MGTVFYKISYSSMQSLRQQFLFRPAREPHMTRWFSRQTISRRVFSRRPYLSSSPVSSREPRILSDVPYTTMSISGIEYGYIEGVENLSDYRPGGYHPIHIDDRLHKRYRIVHKLGHGTFSTAWLALDERTSKYVAIKVGTADADRREVEILSQLTTGVATYKHVADKASMIPIVVDRFSLDGPNGTHPCFITVPARCSLMDAKGASDTRLFQLDVARSLAAQLAMAISLVHSQGYAHGDLHLGNILLQLPSSLSYLPTGPSSTESSRLRTKSLRSRSTYKVHYLLSGRINGSCDPNGSTRREDRSVMSVTYGHGIGGSTNGYKCRGSLAVWTSSTRRRKLLYLSCYTGCWHGGLGNDQVQRRC